MKGATRWMLVTDSHGDMIDPSAAKAAIEFRKHWKPQLTIHAGDWLDLRAMRRGASHEEANEGVRADIEAGLDFIKTIQATVILEGNHDRRLTRETSLGFGRLREYADLLYSQIRDRLGDIRYIGYNKRTGFYQLGNYKVLHGYHSGLYAARQASQCYGNCLIGHVHSNSVFDMPTVTPTTGYSVGCLARLDMEYTEAQPNTLRWQHGFAYGVITPRKETIVWLARKTEQGQWILPSELRTI